MGSQTLEILRQGVWASLTGGWFYDPHQNLFCNTVHLYVWLFLLCLPFSVYLYFPPASLGWAVYCGLVALVFTGLKLLNHALHHLYDTGECVVLPPAADPARDEGMEMQMLRGAAAASSDNESLTAADYNKPNNSTIDLKVDVHRKNSSESSNEDSTLSVKLSDVVGASKSSLCAAPAPAPAPVPAPAPAPAPPAPAHAHPASPRPRRAGRREPRARRARVDDLIVEEGPRPAPPLPADDGPFAKVSRRYHECSHPRRGSNRHFFKEWLYLDGHEAVEPYRSRFARQLSSDSRDNSEPGVGPPSPKKRSHRRRYANYPEESCTKSAIALASAQELNRNMRRNSNSTMSTIQLPLLNSTAQLVSHMRRHSNNADTGFFASVELGEYMMVKAEAPSGDAEKSKGKSPGVRRIKSAALEIGCPPPSVSNLSPHPNSVETIGGQVLKNPKSAVIPPPSKCLTRGPHFNLFPRSEPDEGRGSYPYLTYGSEIVYPIAEISDEMQTSQKETDLDSSGESYSDYEDEKQFRGFDWDAEQSPAVRSSDSDYENNGSRSPLLDRATEVRVVRSKNQDCKKHCCERHSKQNPDCAHSKSKPVRLKKLMKPDGAKCVDRPSGSCECKYPADYFDKASASSKDLLIEKSSVESNENTEAKDEKEVAEKKLWDHDISNSSSSSEANFERAPEKAKEEDEKAFQETEESQVTDSKSADERSIYSIDWLFEESPKEEASPPPCCSTAWRENAATEEMICQKLATALGESSFNVPKNLGAIPKQIKNLARSRASSQKENKKRDSKKENETQEDTTLMDAVEAQAALVQGLECLFAATNANTVVMPAPNREERPRSHRQSVRGERENSHKTRKRSIEEVAQTSTNTLLPTSMPLLAAFLNSRVDLMPCCLPENAPPELVQYAEEGQRLRPLMDRNHRNRVRKIKRSTRQRNNPSNQSNADKKEKTPNPENPNSSNSVHFATSFEDTTDGAIHCFMDEYGNWMSYTFDKNSSGRAQAQPIPLPDKEDAIRMNRVKPVETADSQETGEGSCGSLESEAGNSESIAKPKRENSLDQSSSNQGSNNPLLSSNNNVSAVVPINTNNANKRFYVFDGGTGSRTDQPRSPVAYATDSLLEQIEAERQSRMGFPSMHINFLMSQQRAQREQQAQQSVETVSNNIPSLMPSSNGDESLIINMRSKLSKFMDQIEKANQPKPKSYYKFNLWKCFKVKVTMDRLKLMALFDRNLTFKETFISILLAISVAVLGSMVLNLGFYRDIYAFWFCFIMAGSQYSLLKSVQPDSASPVHGFNKMVVFSRPVYFCICTAILCIVHGQLEQIPEEHSRSKRSVDEKPLTIYGFEMNERDFLLIIQEVLSKFLLFFPLAFSLGLFPQVNTFLMYLLEQIDMHIFGGNATSSLSAAVYCVVRSLAAIGVLYGFAYSGLVEGKKSQHQKHNILFSIFCALLVPIAYHLSRSASDYTLIWNLIKKHLLPPELYVIQTPPECTPEAEKAEDTLTDDKKNNSESNISKQNSIGSSASKINFSSETNIAKTQKRSQTSSVSSLKMDPRGDTMNSTSSLKEPTETEDKSQVKDGPDKPVDEDMEDPLPKKLQATVNARLKNDVIVCTFLGLFVFGLHCTTVFTSLNKLQLNKVVWIICAVGWVLHYVTPQLRKQQPWLCLAGPVLKPHEHAQFEVTEPAKLMCFEKIFVYLCFLERNVLFPGVVVAATTQDAPHIAAKYGDALAALLVCVCALKCLRNAYSEPDTQYLILIFAYLLFQWDLSSQNISEQFLIDYFVTAIIFSKVYEFLLKIQFVVTYIAPWQITWGSAFHAFAQPFSVPHSAMLFLQAAGSALLSSPLTPALGSAIFMTSYVRPVKFWERDYNTKRVDQSNTRLSSQLERNLGADDNNLNSIFYEHLTRSLQHYLCGDLMLGRWGQVQQGDCFVLASDYLNCLVHIVEMGNGLVSFQLRGLEFRGTYCQQREVEAISEGPEESSDGVCGSWACGLGGTRFLAPGAAWALRWLAWQLAAARYVLEGYSVADNSAVSMLQLFDFRKVLLTYYVKSIIYYTIQSAKLEEWLSSPTLTEALKPMSERSFVDLDPIFNVNLDEDYDFRASGITRSRFCAVYQEWIVHCGARRGAGWRRRAAARDGALVTLCFALSVVGRRALAHAQHLSASRWVPSVPQCVVPAARDGALVTLCFALSVVGRRALAHAQHLSASRWVPSVPQCVVPAARDGALVTLCFALSVVGRRALAHAQHLSASRWVPSVPQCVVPAARDGALVTLCFALSVVGRRALAHAQHLSASRWVPSVPQCVVPAARDGALVTLCFALSVVGRRALAHAQHLSASRWVPSVPQCVVPAARDGALVTLCFALSVVGRRALAHAQHLSASRWVPSVPQCVVPAARDGALVTLCFALSVVGRRALAHAQHLSASSVEFFLYGLHSLFKGDFRITCARDEWVFADVRLLHAVLAPAIRMALKLHQDHFMFPEEYCSSSALFSAISCHSARLVICHEAAPAWRHNVLRGAPHLLALRHVMDEGNDDYKIIMLNKRHLGFRVIKLNRECVRGLWAGQQQELVYLRNRNPERGSIQNAKQALRNIINSSCDQPIGYPIYVSPLTTSYADTSPPLCSLLGGPVTVAAIRTKVAALCKRIRRRCGEGCSSGGAVDAAAAEAGAARAVNTPRHNALHLSRSSLAGTRGSLASAGKPGATLASLAGLLRDHAHERQEEPATAYSSTQENTDSRRRSEDRAPAGGARRERNMRARSQGKEPARQVGGRTRLRRERPRPASFRLGAAGPAAGPGPGPVPAGPALAAPLIATSDDAQGSTGSGWEGAWRDQPRRSASSKTTTERHSEESSLKELAPHGLSDVSLPDCKILANRHARQDAHLHRYFLNEGTSKDLSKLSKEIRHERESYRELTGRYIEKPDAIPLKETHYSDLSNKESILKKEAKKDSKNKEIKTKIKRSDSGRSELKMNVSVGSKVLIVEPLGVYDCINLGRRIDVQWPSESQRERGGRNFWGSWVPMAGMDGLVVHKWTPNHRDPKLRSHVDKSILLIQIDDKFVPIAENCVQDLGDEV